MADTKIIAVGIIITITFSISAFSIAWAIMDYRKQKRFLEGLEYRRINGFFDIEQYAEQNRAVKKSSWKKQKNTGPDPEVFQKRLPFIDYFEENMKLTGNKKATV
ncbi:MAG: hypothetical protein HFI75_00460 [Lachnospiraceae bacterium]|nr:hypothetical protein [Lachnospiraceae bacterium]